MDVYIYQAALLCADCGAGQRQHLDQAFIENGAEPVDVDDESSFDSDRYPKGPYSDGGGEADSPQHCDHCGVFLDNPLTEDGSAYVKSAWLEFVETGHGAREVLTTWRDAYPCEFAEFAENLEEGRYGEQSDLALRRFNDLSASQWAV